MRPFYTPLLVAALLVAVCCSPAALAYRTTYAHYNSATPLMAFELTDRKPDMCTAGVPGSHIATATSASIDAAIYEAARSYGLTTIFPIGGGTQQATCLSQMCEWRWLRGFFIYWQSIFFTGVYYTGPESSALAAPVDKTAAVAGSHTNWETFYPISWSNQSYWGKRLVVMDPINGKWKNVEVSTPFSDLVCEFYVYTNSDGANGLIPTFPDGSGIPYNSTSGATYSYCGKAVRKDSDGNWVLPSCGNKFPWWAGLVIAVACYVILIAVIIIVWCCCCINKEKEADYKRQRVIGSEVDNKGHIPNQSELGLSRNRSFTEGDSYTASEASDEEMVSAARE